MVTACLTLRRPRQPHRCAFLHRRRPSNVRPVSDGNMALKDADAIVIDDDLKINLDVKTWSNS